MDNNRSTAGTSLATGLDDLASYLEKSSHVVQEYTDIIEHKYARPALNKISKYFQAQPLTMSRPCSVRIDLFLNFRCVAELPTAAVLLSILGGLLLFSFTLTSAGAMAYLTFRLGRHLQTRGRSGIAEWAHETRQHFTSVSVKSEDNDDSDSGVLVAPGVHDQSSGS
ncbi:uncharacterized protein EDB91DRAFT_1139851 [Suillus paluster]|uniref:uncharacterized protein n=1 Tax=Suillus paluster TaxID=48578 RepID=UPI001B85C03E|nr:uncharacterized protein EDB91DRAFT_1139851 [Suillus paluster]KAG1737460.1 hypothetical protein EDB91DRAFT_1139851 [Suillus paluster]